MDFMTNQLKLIVQISLTHYQEKLDYPELCGWTSSLPMWKLPPEKGEHLLRPLLCLSETGKMIVIQCQLLSEEQLTKCKILCILVSLNNFVL